MVNGLACQMPVTVCLLGDNLNVHAKPEKHGLSRDTTAI